MSFMSRVSSYPYENASFGERLALNMMATAVWPFEAQDRISLLITLFANELLRLDDSDDAIEAVLDQIRIELKLARWRNQLANPVSRPVRHD